MHYIKTWRLYGKVTDAELTWLYKCNIKVEMNYDNMIVALPSYLSIPGQGERIIFIKTIDAKQETMLLLKYSERLVCTNVDWYSDLHGTKIEF